MNERELEKRIRELKEVLRDADSKLSLLAVGVADPVARSVERRMEKVKQVGGAL